MPLERQIASHRLNRIVRTPYSEVYLIWDNQTRIGQIDIHYSHQTVYATLVLEQELDVASEEGLIAQVDEQIVQAYLPNFDREDFLVTVFRGEEISNYTDTSGSSEDDIEEIEE